MIGTESLEKHLCGGPCSLAALGTLQHVSKARLACWMRKGYVTQLFKVVGVITFSSYKEAYRLGVATWKGQIVILRSQEEGACHCHQGVNREAPGLGTRQNE